MRAHRRISLSILVMGSLSAGAFVLFQGPIVLPSLVSVDDSSSGKDFARVIPALGVERASLAAIAADYGRWDDSCRFACSRDQSYVEGNFQPSTFANL